MDELNGISAYRGTAGVLPNQEADYPPKVDDEGSSDGGGSPVQESPGVLQNVEVSVLPTLQLGRKRQHPQTGIIEEVAIHCSAENSDVLVSVAEWLLQNQDRLEFAKDNSKRGGGQ